IPYTAAGCVESFGDGIFESVSAFTTTDATVIQSFKTMPNWLRLYRAICEWVGGAFSLVVLSLALKSLSYDENGLEVSNQDAGLYRSGIRITSIIKRLLLTYAVLTF
ncbi:MAG: potassium transporter TrkG, partial [Bacillota bacterium]|nr:potassium transporter TrkG [Bacillota bacterium]